MPRVEIVACGSPGENRQPMIQQALDAVALAGGGEVFLPDGEYIIGPGDGDPVTTVGEFSLRIGDNTHLRMGPGTTLIRRFYGKGGSGTIVNAGVVNNTPNTNIMVSGGTIKTLNSANEGKHLNFSLVGRLAVRDTQFLGVEKDWNTAFVDCTNVTVSGVFMNSGVRVGEDGLHFVGGSQIAVDNCVITSGDDALSLTQEGLNGTDMSDVVATNCTLISRASNALRIWAHNVDDNEALSIRRVRVANCVGSSGTSESGGGRGIEIVDEQNQKRITDVDVDGFTLNGQYNGAEAFRIFGVSRVRMRGVVCRTPNVGGLIDASDEVELVDCAVESPRGGTAACLKVAQTALCLDTRILGGRYLAGKANGIVLGSASAQAVRPQVANARIANVTGSGLLATSAILALVCDNHIFGCTSYGIDDGPGSLDNAYIANYFYANGGGTTGPLRLQGGRPYAIRNVTQPTAPIVDTGGFRQTVDGWLQPNVQGTVGVEMQRVIGRFRVPRGGSVTGLIVAVNNPWTAGILQVDVRKNSGNAGAAGTIMSIAAVIDSLSLPDKTYKTQPQDTAGCIFAAGDELYIGLLTTGWNSNVGGLASNVYVAIEIET